MHFIKQAFIDPDVQPVILDASRVDLTQHFNVLSRLRDFDPVLFGGALRDAFANVNQNDFDICLANDNTDLPLNLETPADFDQSMAENKIEYERLIAEHQPNKEHATSPDIDCIHNDGINAYYRELLQNIRSFDEWMAISASQGYTEKDICRGLLGGLSWQKRDKLFAWLEKRGVEITSNPHELTYQHIMALSVKGRVSDQYVDLIFANGDVRKAPILAMMGDAPINCIAMAGDGQIWAHPDFERDLQSQSYKLRVKGDEALSRGRQRCEVLRARYPKMHFSVMGA